MEALLAGLEQLAALHGRNDSIWSDFFHSCGDKLKTDPAFGCDYLMTAWGGMYAYPEQARLENAEDEQARLEMADIVYKLANEIKNDSN